jgi:CubicO group peptidase (beta-lactamase class C family)
MAEVHGTCEPKFEQVRTVLSDSLDSGADLGASVAVYLHGEPVVDIWGGHTDEDKSAPWQRDTLTTVWSLTKTMTFVCALMLADRSELDFHAPVAKYWPEFAAAGKEVIEVRHIMGHTAGLSGWDEPISAEQLADWELCTSLLAAQKPWWQPGSASGYHACTQGFLIGEVVRRITGESIGAWFAREVAKPLGADFFIGAPESVDERIVDIIAPPPFRVEDLPTEVTEFTGRTLLNPPLDATMAHHAWWRRAEIPASNGQGNARSMAAIQSVIAGRGQTGGVRLLSAEATDVIFQTQAEGTDLVLGVPMRFGMGYGLMGDPAAGGPRVCFWGGYGGSLVVVDQDRDLTVSYVMNKMSHALVGDVRGASFVQAAVQGLTS